MSVETGFCDTYYELLFKATAARIKGNVEYARMQNKLTYHKRSCRQCRMHQAALIAEMEKLEAGG